MTVKPADLIDLRTAVKLLGPEPVGIVGLIAAGKLTEYRVNGVVRLSRQEVLEHRFRAAGPLPVAEVWNGHTPH